MLAAVGLATVLGACILPTPAYGLPVACNEPQLDGGVNGCPGDCDTLLADGGALKDDPQSGCGGAP